MNVMEQIFEIRSCVLEDWADYCR